jgi:hypothetical protein
MMHRSCASEVAQGRRIWMQFSSCGIFGIDMTRRPCWRARVRRHRGLDLSRRP